MDSPIFDAMLKTALEEALRRDIAESPEPPAPSRRQRKRMRKLLAGPAGGPREMEERRFLPSARWLAVVIVAALLTGAAAAGFSLGGGEWFRQWFDEVGAADICGSAVDTDQLLGMGVEMTSNAVESGGMRLEVYDAVFDGQRLLMFVRMTFLAPDLLEEVRTGREWSSFEKIELLLKDGTGAAQEIGGWSFRAVAESWMEPDLKSNPGPGECPLLFQLDLENLGGGGEAELRMTDLCLRGADGSESVWPGEWTLSMTLRPGKTLRLPSPRDCPVNGVDWVLESLELSPLTLRIELHCPGTQRPAKWMPYKDLAIHMKTGEVVGLRAASSSAGIGGHSISVRLDFAIPLDLEQVDYIHICGQDIFLEE